MIPWRCTRADYGHLLPTVQRHLFSTRETWLSVGALPTPQNPRFVALCRRRCCWFVPSSGRSVEVVRPFWVDKAGSAGIMFNHMVDHSRAELDLVFSAVADPIRRAIL